MENQSSVPLSENLNESKPMKQWIKDWLNTHKSSYYIYPVNNKSVLRIQFFNPKTQMVETISRSVAKYGLKMAREELFREFKRRTGYKEKLQSAIVQKGPQRQPKDQNVQFYHDYSELPLSNWFDIDTGFSLAMIAKSKSGKTTLISKIYNEILKPIFPITFLSSGSITAEIYKPFKKALKMSSFNPKIAQMCYSINKHTKNKYKFLFIADDMDKDDRYQNTISNMMTKWRNYNISSIFLIQDATMLTPTMRSNVNYIAIGNLGSERLNYIVELLYPYLAKGHQTKATNQTEIQKLVKLATKDYGFIFLDNLTNCVYLPDKVNHLLK